MYILLFSTCSLLYIILLLFLSAIAMRLGVKEDYLGLAGVERMARWLFILEMRYEWQELVFLQ